jgi:hypothetical protein
MVPGCRITAGFALGKAETGKLKDERETRQASPFICFMVRRWSGAKVQSCDGAGSHQASPFLASAIADRPYFWWSGAMVQDHGRLCSWES